LNTCIIFNPAAGSEKAKRFRSHLASFPTVATLKPTYGAGSARELAAAAVREGFDTIVAAGGDGTVNEVLNGLGEIPENFARVRLGVIPIGTVNVFARELGIHADFAAACRVIQQGKETRIDLPEAEYSGGSGLEHRYFAQLAGAGLDSRAIELVNAKHKKAIGPLAYVIAGFKALAERKTRVTALVAPHMQCSGELVLIGNGRFYGGSFELFPKANLRDGLLSVTVFPRVNWGILFRSAWGWLFNRLHAAAGCRTFQASAFSLSGDPSVPLELDGENVGHLPAKFSVSPGALRVIVP
jgi:YegS/Rv2252/BmrU family lipid kinase